MDKRSSPIPGSSSLSERAYSRIREAIRSGTIRGGERLRFSGLQDLCGTSVTPIREALSRLAAEGFTVLEENKGYRVSPLSLSELWDITRNRQHLEERALRLAIERGDPDWEAAVLAAHHVMSRVPRQRPDLPTAVDAEWDRHHAHFHRTLISACDSPVLLSFCDALYWRADLYRRITISQTPRANSAEEHRAICESAIFRRADEACRLLSDHYEKTARVVEEFFGG